ncbi:MAG: heavy metal-binding domain-containing protein [Eubacteriales bacterium]|nr:heavy metal-binding domain-containing protein [Eubacteriales bacterium]
MIITTTNNIEGYNIVEYRGIVFGEVITGVNFLKDMGAAFRDIFGGRSSGYEGELIQAREEALQEIANRATALGCDAVIGAKMDYEVLGANGSMLMVTVSGTAVKLG